MKATHAGHCQACGRLQRLPKGRLSLHGYQVLGGFFSGICRGARHEPFEISCDLVRTFIREAADRLARVEGQQRHLRRPATEPRAMVHNYENIGRGKRAYVWREVMIDGRRRDDGRVEYFYRAPGYLTPSTEPVEHRVDRFHSLAGAGDQSLVVATEYNKIYADWLDHEVDSLRRYIAWQEDRVRTWKPADLPFCAAPGAKDEEGFVPTKPKY